MNTLIIALIVAVIGPVILSYMLSKQRAKEKAQDYARQDAVADAKRKQDEEVSEQAAKAAKLLLDRQDEVAKQAEGVAKLLLDAQTKTTKETAEVARLAAEGGTAETGYLAVGRVEVTLAYPNGNRQEVFLAEVPRAGEHIRLTNGPNSPPLIVDHVLWMEIGTPPRVILVVHPAGGEAAPTELTTTRKGST